MRKSPENLLLSEISLLPSRGKKWSVRAAAVFPNSYPVGMSNIGFLTLFARMHDFHQLYPQRFFKNFDVSLEERMPLSAFPIIAASIAYEMDFFNFVDMLRRGGVSVDARQRENSIVIVGGAAVTINPVPLSLIADAIFIGQGKNSIRRIMQVVAENPPGISSKVEILNILSKFDGVWVPAIDKNIPARAIPDDETPPFSEIVSSFSALPNMMLVQIQRGCPFRCPFCATPTIYNPFYNFSFDKIAESFERWANRIFRVGLVGSAIADHPELGNIIDYLNSRKVEIYTSSLRLDRLKPETISSLRLSRQKSLTFAPETASERLKSTIGKDVSLERLIEICEKLSPREIKLYYIIGLPEETDDDVAAIAKDVKKISDALTKTRIVVSVNAFIPKKGTKWGHRKMAPHALLQRRAGILRRLLGNVKNVRLNINYKRRSRLQWAFSCGEDDVANAMLKSKDLNELVKNIRKNRWDI
ncbi:radical SAM protein [bacterium]|nr:radical SAM protein [bacterium]